MDQVHVIRHKVLVEGESQRQVAKALEVSRNTVRKYMTVSEPRATKRSRKRPVMDAVEGRLEELLREWSGRTTKKQRLTGRRVYRQLREEGYPVGESTVCAYIRAWKLKRAEIFVPLVYRAGEEGQVDFFEVTVEMSGERKKLWMFLLRLMYSKRDFAWLYERCDQVSFLDGHVRAFAHLGGVPGRLVYDNLKPAVKRVLVGGRELTGRFQALVSHYLVEPCFARVGVGHDKGGVEGRGKGIRYQHLVPIPRGESVEAIASELLGALDTQAHESRDREGRTVMDRFEEEAKRLRPLPEVAFDARRLVPVTLNRQSLVRLDGAMYSLPTRWRGASISAYVGPSDVRFVDRDETVVRPRVRKPARQIQYVDYLSELEKKPQAVRQVAPELMAELGSPFVELWKKLEMVHGGQEAGRVMARLLRAVRVHGRATMAPTLQPLLEKTPLAATRAVASLLKDTWPKPTTVPLPLSHITVESARASDFDALLTVAS